MWYDSFVRKFENVEFKSTLKKSLLYFILYDAIFFSLSEHSAWGMACETNTMPLP